MCTASSVFCCTKLKLFLQPAFESSATWRILNEKHLPCKCLSFRFEWWTSVILLSNAHKERCFSLRCLVFPWRALHFGTVCYWMQPSPHTVVYEPSLSWGIWIEECTSVAGLICLYKRKSSWFSFHLTYRVLGCRVVDSWEEAITGTEAAKV